MAISSQTSDFSMPYRFENLEVWKEARIFVNTIYSITKTFPKDERFSLISQLRRAALSVLLNITEGSDRKSDIEFIRFLRISYTSMEEVIAACYIALDQKYLPQQEFDSIYNLSHILGKKINALIRSIQKVIPPPLTK